MSIPESHLAQEAIAALVDGELPAGPAGRAARHLSGCLQCRLAVEAQREAKAALQGDADVAVPGDLMSRLRAIPFTAEMPPGGGLGEVTVGAGRLTAFGASGAFSFPLGPAPADPRPNQARWLRRGVAGTLVGLGVGVAVLAVSLPSGDLPAGDVPPPGSVAGPISDSTTERTDVVPPVVRTLTVGHSVPAPGGTP